ncbi:helix-turn-helix domain-containing protein [Vallitalea guaymasensis]|uniref:helix-turn-helix domain-containing protein n=1 Tax=Vallitalea guaymasensis TaxID=1185412 RepID=UPI002354A4A1|nr:helix-turn-helix transcriptional regulator [Vallitalea guaymasensis]
MNERLKLIRQDLNLTQLNFANALNISQANLSRIEKGIQPLTERIVNDICREFKVNEEWLRTGEGEMFKEDDFFFDLGYYTQDASDIDKAIIIEFLKLDEESKETMIKYWKNVINKLENQ